MPRILYVDAKCNVVANSTIDQARGEIWSYQVTVPRK